MSPKFRFNLIFWTVTAPIVPYVLFLVLIGFLAYLSPRHSSIVQDMIELHVSRLCKWRNNLGIVKRAGDKAYLFEYIKGFE